MKRLLAGLGAALLVLVAVVAIRTALYTPIDGGAVPALAPVTIDADRVAGRLAEAIRFRTISFGPDQPPDAAAFDGFIAWITATWPDLTADLHLTRIGDYTVLLRWDGRDPAAPPVLLTGHYDVVPVIAGTEGGWRHPPFAGVIADGKVWGRGALDNKGAVVAMLEAADALRATGFQPARTVYFSFGHDEELGGEHGAAAVVEHLQAAGVRLAWSLDEGSFVFEGLLPGIDAPVATINTAEKGGVSLEIIARGAGGHSSMPPDRTAVTVLAEALVRLHDHPLPGGLDGLSLESFDRLGREMGLPLRLAFANRWLFGGLIERRLATLPFGNAMLRTTTAPTMLSASPKVNVLPIEARAVVNFRIHPRDTPDSILAHVRAAVAAADVEVVSLGGRPASAVSRSDAPGFRQVAAATRAAYGDFHAGHAESGETGQTGDGHRDIAIAPGLMIAGSDSRHYGLIADDAYRFNPFPVTPDDMTGFHGTDERLSVDGLARGARAYATLLHALE